MVLQNRGTLVAYDRQKIEIRYDPENLNLGVFAIEPGTNHAIALRPVKKIDMLNHEDMVEQLEWKKRQMRAVQQAFEAVTSDKNVRVLSEPQKFSELHKAETLAEKADYRLEHKKPEVTIPTVTKKADTEPVETRPIPQSVSRKKMDFGAIPESMNHREEVLSQEDFLASVASRIGSEAFQRASQRPVFYDERERFDWVLNQFHSGGNLSREDLDFMYDYEEKMDSSQTSYYESYSKKFLGR